MSFSRLVVGVVALLAFAPLAQAETESLQVIGWSADEQRFAVRAYSINTDEMGDDEVMCPGYVDHAGKPFRGSLRLQVYEKGTLLSTHPIQDSEECIPPKKARERLAQAKADFAKRGIDLKQKQPGTELTPDKKGHVAVKQGPGAPYTLEGEQQVEEKVVRSAEEEKARAAMSEEERENEDDSYQSRTVKGELVVFVRKGSERRKLVSQKVEGSYMPAMGGTYGTSLRQVWLSPTGKTVVLISVTSSGDMRSLSESMQVLGVLSWDGVPLVLR